MSKVVKYSQVESEEVSLMELVKNSQNYIIEDITEKEYCTTCNQELRKYKNQRYIKYVCGCGCRIFYPRKDGIKLSKWVKAEDYKKNKHQP